MKQKKASPLFIKPDGQEHSLLMGTFKAEQAQPAPPMPEEPCFSCHCNKWWLLDNMVWRCDACHPPVGTPSRKARAVAYVAQERRVAA